MEFYVTDSHNIKTKLHVKFRSLTHRSISPFSGLTLYRAVYVRVLLVLQKSANVSNSKKLSDHAAHSQTSMS